MVEFAYEDRWLKILKILIPRFSLFLSYTSATS